MTLYARDLMQTALITVAPDTPFLQIQHLFVVAQISGAPVVDHRGAVLGVISSVDLLRAVDQACDEDVDIGPVPVGTSTPSPSRDSLELSEDLKSLVATDIATPGAVWVSPDDKISEVARVMRTEGIHRVLVGREQRLEGILSTFDLLKAL
jgi:CBS domain-containing protein